LRRELRLLDATITRAHVFDEDIALARIPDTQGLGGASEARARKKSAIGREHEQRNA
jgi:hypothetical protein